MQDGLAHPFNKLEEIEVDSTFSEKGLCVLLEAAKVSLKRLKLVFLNITGEELVLFAGTFLNQWYNHRPRIL